MATTADALGIVRGTTHEQPVNIKLYPDNQGDVAHKENMPPRRHEVDEEFDIREAVSQQALTNRRILQLLEAQAVQTQMSHAQPVNNQRSVDTLRRDIGIFSILIAMMIQTGAAFYWAGGVSRSQEAARETIKQVQDDQAYTRAQLQLIDGKLQKIEGRESERERIQKGR